MPATVASRRRVDHVPLYQFVVSAQAIIAVLILAQFVYTTVFYWMSLLVETVAGVALLLGALGCLFGIASGTRHFRPGADIRDCYTIEAWSIVLIVLPMALFALGIARGSPVGLRNEIGMVLILMVAVILGLAAKAVDFHREVRRLSDDLVRRVTEEASRGHS